MTWEFALGALISFGVGFGLGVAWAMRQIVDDATGRKKRKDK
jgi:hypothetical protein